MPKFLALALAVITAIVIAFCAPSAKSTSMRPPSIEDLRGNWLGQSANGEFARLTLDRTGHGVLALNYYPDQPVWRYKVAVEKAKRNPLGYELSIRATPIGHKHSLRIIEAVGFSNRINFQIADSTFKSVYSLTPELEAIDRIKTLIRTSRVK